MGDISDKGLNQLRDMVKARNTRLFPLLSHTLNEEAGFHNDPDEEKGEFEIKCTRLLKAGCLSLTIEPYIIIAATAMCFTGGF